MHTSRVVFYLEESCNKFILSSPFWQTVFFLIVIVFVQSLSCVWLFATRWTAAHQASLPPLPPRIFSNSCPSSQWCHPTISSSVVHFSSCLQSFPASVSLPMSQLLASGGQRIGASASVSVLPMNIQGWFPLGSTGLISLQSKGLSRVFSSTTGQKHQFFGAHLSLWSNSYLDMTTGKPIALTTWTFVGKMMPLLFNTLFRFVTACWPRSKCVLIAWLQSQPIMILEPKKIKSVSVSTFSSPIC